MQVLAQNDDGITLNTAIAPTLRVNITETLSVVLIREQGEKEFQYDKQEDRRHHHRDVGSGPTQ